MPEQETCLCSSDYPMPLSSRVTVLGNHTINLFLVQCDRKTALFEVGISGVVDTVIQQLDHLGAVPDFLIVSHPHSDHITGLLGFLFPGKGFWPLFFTGAKEYLDTQTQIQAMAPAIVCPGHQGPLQHQAATAGIQAGIDAACHFIERVTRTSLTDHELEARLFKESYRDEFTLYTRENIVNCNRLLIKRARQMTDDCLTGDAG